MTQARLAEEAGLAQSTIASLEHRPGSGPNLGTVMALGHGLGLLPIHDPQLHPDGLTGKRTADFLRLLGVS